MPAVNEPITIDQVTVLLNDFINLKGKERDEAFIALLARKEFIRSHLFQLYHYFAGFYYAAGKHNCLYTAKSLLMVFDEEVPVADIVKPKIQKVLKEGKI